MHLFDLRFEKGTSDRDASQALWSVHRLDSYSPGSAAVLQVLLLIYPTFQHVDSTLLLFVEALGFLISFLLLVREKVVPVHWGRMSPHR